MSDFLTGLFAVTVLLSISYGIGCIGIPEYDTFHKTAAGLTVVFVTGCIIGLCYGIGGIIRLLIGEDNEQR